MELICVDRNAKFPLIFNIIKSKFCLLRECQVFMLKKTDNLQVSLICSKTNYFRK